MTKKQAPKCIRCKKNLKRRSHTYHSKKEPYNGNMICYRVKKRRLGEWDHNSPYENYKDKRTGDIRERPTVFIPKVPEEYNYSYTLWDGISYQYLWGHYKFCGQQCAAMWACAFVGKAKK